MTLRRTLRQFSSRGVVSPLLALLLASCLGRIQGDNELGAGRTGQGSEPSTGAESAIKGAADDGPGPGTIMPPAPGGNGGPVATPYTALGFEALPLRVGASKAKDLLTGLALTPEEMTVIGADPSVLGGLVDSWVARPEAHATLQAFFADTFQQRPISLPDVKEFAFHFSMYTDHPYGDDGRIKRALQEMFARTALALVDEGRPFNEVATTDRFMLNLPLIAALSFIDARPHDDRARLVEPANWILKKFPGFTVFSTMSVDPTTNVQTPIPFEESIDPASPNFMRWTRKISNLGCMNSTKGDNAIIYAYLALYGARIGCGAGWTSEFTAAEWDTWRWVTLREARAGEEPDLFWNLPKFRDPKFRELVVTTPRIGFFSTPAFFAKWPTNAANSFRVTLNQTLIVALGHALTDASIVPVVQTTSSEADHAQMGTICYGCHQTLDPARDFFRQQFSTAGTPRPPGVPLVGMPTLDPTTFSINGSPVVRGRGIQDLGRALATHPQFASAWTQKLCVWANTIPCAEDDPEFKRVAEKFRSSGFNFKILLRELLSSPLTTYAEPTRSAEVNGVVPSIARREVLCNRLSARFRKKDYCRLAEVFNTYDQPTQNPGLRLSLGVPASDHGRGEATAVMPRDPSLLFGPAASGLCAQLASESNDMLLNPSDLKKTFADFVTLIMGIPPADPLYDPLLTIVRGHYEAALKTPPARTSIDALRSTLRMACTTPLATSQGL